MLKLRKRSEFQRVYKKGGAHRAKSLRLYAIRNELAQNRVGFVIPARKTRLSVGRNRSRRMISESYRLTEGLIKKGYDIIFFVEKDISGSTSRDVMEEILYLYKKSRLVL